MALFLFVLSITLFLLGGVFYSSASSFGHGDALSDDVCAVGSMFCQHPGWLLVAGVIGLCLAALVRIVAAGSR